jgi:uncharacterized membrane protein
MNSETNSTPLQIQLQLFKIATAIANQVKVLFNKHLTMEVISIDLATLLSNIKVSQEQYSQMKCVREQLMHLNQIRIILRQIIIYKMNLKFINQYHFRSK